MRAFKDEGQIASAFISILTLMGAGGLVGLTMPVGASAFIAFLLF